MAILLIDMDDTVADLTGKVIELHREYTGETIYRDTLTSWERNGKMFRELYLKEGIYLDLDVLPDAVEVLQKLSERHRIFFVTAAPTALAAYEKKLWVDRHFPFIGQMNVITTRDKYLIDGHVLLDDSPVFLPSFKGFRVLIDAPHNKDMQHNKEFDTLVFDMKGFLELIRQMEKVGALKESNKDELEAHAVKPLGQV